MLSTAVMTEEYNEWERATFPEVFFPGPFVLLKLSLSFLQKTAADELAQKEGEQNNLKGKEKDSDCLFVRFCWTSYFPHNYFHLHSHPCSSGWGKHRQVENGRGQSEKTVRGEKSSMPLPETKHSRSKVGVMQYWFYNVYCSSLSVHSNTPVH